MSANPWNPQGPNPNPNDWWTHSAYVPNWQQGQGVVGAPKYGAATSGQQAGGGVPNWTITGNGLMGRLDNNPTSSPMQVQLLNWASGYRQRGLSEQDAYNLAASEMRQMIAQTGAAPSEFTILPYTPGMLDTYNQALQQSGGNSGNALGRLAQTNNNWTSWLNGAAQWTGAGWKDMGKGDLTGQAPPNQQQNQNNTPGNTAGNTTGNTASTNSPYSSPSLGGNQAAWTGPTSTNDLQNQALLSDPETAYRYMMEGMGYNPDAPGFYNSFLHDTEEPLIGHALSLLGIGGGNAAEMTPGFLQQLGTSLVTPGSNGLANLQNWAHGQAGAFGNALNQLTNQQQAAQSFGDIKALEMAGSNPLLSQAVHDIYTRSAAGYGDYAFQHELGQHHNIDPYISWLQSGPYAGLFSDVYF